MVSSWARIYGGNSHILKSILRASEGDLSWVGALIPSVTFSALDIIAETDKAYTLVMLSDSNPFDGLVSLPFSEDVTITMGWEYGLGVKNRIQGIVRVELTEEEIATIDNDTDQYEVIIMNMLNDKMNQVW